MYSAIDERVKNIFSIVGTFHFEAFENYANFRQYVKISKWNI